MTSNVNGKKIFFPAGGYYNGLTLINRGSGGDYWTRGYSSEQKARAFGFTVSSVSPTLTSDRFRGYLIRAVQVGSPNRSIVPPTPEDNPKEEETSTEEEPKDKDER